VPVNNVSEMVSNRTNFRSRDLFEKDQSIVGTSGGSEIDDDDQSSNKRNPRAPDFKHRVSKKGLWIDRWYTPKWVKDRLL
jgi:hypothetical protein